MLTTRTLNWSAALRDLKDDRRKRHPIREERLRATAGLRTEPALAFSAWRGQSGKRYVVSVHDLTPATLDDAGPAVVIAVRRDAEGVAIPVSVETFETTDGFASFRHVARAAGATELHVHRLAATAAAGATAVLDLTSPAAG